MPTIVSKCELKGEVRKVSEKNLTVKDFSCLETLGGVSRTVTVGGYLRISVEVNCKSKDYKVLNREIV